MAHSRRRRLNVTKHLRLESLERRHLLAAEGLISHWPLDVRDSGFTLRDEVGTNHLSAIGQLLLEDSDRGRAIVRHDSGSPGSPITNLEPDLSAIEEGVTVSAWINRSSDFGGFALAVSPLGVQLGTEGDLLHFNATTTDLNGSTIDNRVESVFEFQNDTWYHIAGTYNGERQVLYINGDDIASNADASGPLKLDGELFVGSGWTATNSSIREFRGQLDDVKLFNRALDPEEILGLSRAPSGLETSDEPGVYNGEPIRIDPAVEISSEREQFAGGALQATFDPPTTFREGDLISVVITERIAVENGDVFFVNDGSETQIGEVGEFASRRLRIELNQNATPAATEALARALTFRTTASDSHDRLLTISLSTHDDVTAFADVRKIVFGQTNTLVLETSAGASEYQAGEAIVVDPQVEVVSSEQNLDGGSLSVSFVEASARETDQLAVLPTGQISVDEGSVVFHAEGPAVVIGTVSGGENGKPLVIDLNENSTGHAAEALARAVGYRNSDDVPPEHPRFVRFALNDGKGGETSGVKKIEIARQNAPPQIDAPDGTTSFSGGSEPVPVLPSVSIVDTDSPDFAGGRLKVEFVEESAKEGDRLSIHSTDAILVDGGNVLLQRTAVRVGEVDLAENGRILVVHFNQNMNADVAEWVARAVHFGNNAVNPQSGTRLVQFELHDGDGGSDSDVRQVEVSHLNQAPVIEFSEGAAVYTERAEAVEIDDQVEVADADSEHFDGGQLIASFVQQSRQEGDHLALRSSANLAIDGSNILLIESAQPIKIAEFGFGEGGLIIEFGETADLSAVQEVARHITFASEHDNLSGEDRLVRFRIIDADGADAFDVRRIVINLVNDQPIVQTNQDATVFEVSDEPVIVAPLIAIEDPDSEHFGGGTLVIGLVEQTGVVGDVLSIRTGEGIEIDGGAILFVSTDLERIPLGEIRDSGDNPLQLAIDLTEHATPALTQYLARSITFGSSVTSPGENPLRLVEFVVTEADGSSGADVKRIELVEQPDEDSDGVNNDVEDQAPNQGDGNGDGIPDSEQDRVASVRGSNESFVTIASPEDTRLVNVQPMDDPSPHDRPEDTEFPVGFFDFEVEGVGSAEPTMVTVNLEPGSTANSYYVFGPTPDEPIPHWYPFHYDGETGAKIYADRIELYYIDGKRGDADLVENGIIADPGAPAIASHPWQNPLDPGDVNHDGSVTVLDALLIINDLARFSPRSLPLLPEGAAQLAEKFLDVSGDNHSSTLDALQVINILARSRIAAPPSAEFVTAFRFADDDDERQWDGAIDEVAGELF